jgi:hypothetical protein
MGKEYQQLPFTLPTYQKFRCLQNIMWKLPCSYCKFNGYLWMGVEQFRAAWRLLNQIANKNNKARNGKNDLIRKLSLDIMW